MERGAGAAAAAKRRNVVLLPTMKTEGIQYARLKRRRRLDSPEFLVNAMATHLNENELKCLREIALADGEVESRIPQASLAKLLKFGLVETRNMLTLWITWRGRQWLAVEAPELARNDVSKPVKYSVLAHS
jgi:hypothetical protein